MSIKTIGMPHMALAFLIWGIKLAMAGVFLRMLAQAHVFHLLNNWSFSGRQWMAIGGFVILSLLIVGIISVENYSNRQLAILLLSHQATGFFEEFLFRGVLLLGVAYALLKSGNETPIVKTAVISSLAFGGVHLINVLSGASMVDTLLQIFFASLIGMGFIIFVVIVRNIWVVSVFHGIVNTFSLPEAYTFIPEQYIILIMACVILGGMLILYKTEDETALVMALKDK